MDVVAPEMVGFVWSLVAMHFVDWAPGSGTLMVGPPAPGGHVHETDPPGADGAGAGDPGFIPFDDPDPAVQPLPAAFVFLVDGAL